MRAAYGPTDSSGSLLPKIALIKNDQKHPQFRSTTKDTSKRAASAENSGCIKSKTEPRKPVARRIWRAFSTFPARYGTCVLEIVSLPLMCIVPPRMKPSSTVHKKAPRSAQAQLRWRLESTFEALRCGQQIY
eukprot:6765112-Pyramimonas_sp.AAC.1